MNIVEGDILNAKVDAIIHQVNCQGVMGAGLAKQIKDRFPLVYEYYREWCKDPHYNPPMLPRSPLLGSVQVIYPDDKSNLAIVNLFAQDKFGRSKCYTDYDALRECLKRVNEMFRGLVVAVPYGMSCGLAGGDWSIVSTMIEKELRSCKVIVYRLKGAMHRGNAQ